MTEFLAIPVPTLSSSRRRCAPLSSHHCSRKSRVPSSRSEEHTSELQSQSNLVCRLLLEKKNRRCDSRPPIRRRILGRRRGPMGRLEGAAHLRAPPGLASGGPRGGHSPRRLQPLRWIAFV